MKSKLSEPVEYQIPLGDDTFPIGDSIGRTVTLKFDGDIFCVGCGRKIKKTFADGYCYPCFQNHPECDPCVLRPELCEAHEGRARDMDWAREHCLQKHVVYLSVSSNLKVGVTRMSQVPTRWIDQGAHMAIRLAHPPNRHTAGLIEVELKKHIQDKTDWRRMLKNEHPDDIDLRTEKKRMLELLPADLKKFAVKDNAITRIAFPVLEYPQKVKSIGFDKQPEIKGKLMGIKGQYLIFDGGLVTNLRKHQGYVVSISSR